MVNTHCLWIGGLHKGGGVVQSNLIGTEHNASDLQLQNWLHRCPAKCRAQPDLIQKTIQDMQCKRSDASEWDSTMGFIKGFQVD